MASVSEKNGSFSVRAHVGDAKTLFAFNIDKAGIKNLAGFTIKCKPQQGDEYFLLNTLQFAQPGHHAQVPSQPFDAGWGDCDRAASGRAHQPAQLHQPL